MRLDQYLVTTHHFSRNKAQQLIKSGLISINGAVNTKSSFIIYDGDSIIVQDDRRVEWVSRSAEKLAGFLEYLSKSGYTIAVENTHCLDIGSSTGGFSQVLLSLGATSIDAVDVGTNQLHTSLRNHPSIHSFEQTDIRDFSRNSRKSYEVIVCDVSFISLKEILDPILTLAQDDTYIILLYKPQFEVGKENLRKTGVPKDEKCIAESMRSFEKILREKHLVVQEKQKSILMGEAGNQEWLYLMRKISS